MVIFLANFNLTIKLSILTIIQASHLMYLLIVRPYEDRKDFLLEWISQFIVVNKFFSAILSKFNSKNDWNSFLNWTLIIAIMVWALISNIISFIYLLITIAKKAKALFKNRKVRNYRSSLNRNVSNIVQDNLNVASIAPSRQEIFEETKEKIFIVIIECLFSTSKLWSE